MVVVVFRTRLKTGIDEQKLTAMGERMYEIASGMAGFISYKDFAAADGENVSIVEFESLEALASWRSPGTGQGGFFCRLPGPGVRADPQLPLRRWRSPGTGLARHGSEPALAPEDLHLVAR
jgi:hypothetical protein